MYKTQGHWNCGTPQQDSGSEGTPLLSSGSHASLGPVMFQDSETSDLDSNPDTSSRYGSVGAASFSSTVTVLPKRLPPLMGDNLVSPPTTVSSPLTLANEKCYEIHNIDLLLENDRCAATSGTKDFIEPFLPGSFPIQQDVSQTTHKDIKSKQSSLVTVFSVWNTTLGSSLLTMPWGITMAGFFPGIILMLVMSGICLYTAYRLLSVHKSHGGGEKIEVIELSRIYLGRWAEYVARIFSITVLLGSMIAYWILMSNFLYNSVNFVYDNIAGIPVHPAVDNGSFVPEVLCPKKDIFNGSHAMAAYDFTHNNLGPAWNLYRTVPIFLAVIIFPILNFNSTTFFTKFNSLGTASILYLIIFVILKSVFWGVNMSNAEWEISWILRPTFPALSGMLALSFFIHNIIITIMQNNHDQSKNGRDLSIAYILVTITYIIIGVAFYISFPLAKSCIEDNLLNNFQKWDGLTVGARMVLLFQLLTVYPLITYMLRIQLLSYMCKTSSSRAWVLIINLIVVSVCILFATFLPHIGTIIRYTGAISGLIYVFTLPSLLHLAILHKRQNLTMFSLCLHLLIPIIGGSNLIAQFFITDH